MLTDLFLPEAPGVRVERFWREGATLHLAATTTRRYARCPLCRRRSKRVHSHYRRTIADLPCGAARVCLHLRTRRFVTAIVALLSQCLLCSVYRTVSAGSTPASL